MTTNKRYKVIAKMTTYLYVYVDANSYTEAVYIAKEMDGGDFVPINQGIVAEGDWEIVDVMQEA
jgi:hypothetical protein